VGAPYVGQASPGVYRPVFGGGTAGHPASGARTAARSAASYCAHRTVHPGAGARSAPAGAQCFSNGVMVPPTCVKNLMSEMMAFF
jgi:hypothetical protein